MQIDESAENDTWAYTKSFLGEFYHFEGNAVFKTSNAQGRGMVRLS